MASEDTQILDASLNKIQETLAKAGEDKSPAEIAPSATASKELPPAAASAHEGAAPAPPDVNNYPLVP